ncbi:MAG TPA: STAS domain-containing protein [Opitutaceae bacterium]|nr:STAS domain-containing protein [Opitutaceae bacterium]
MADLPHKPVFLVDANSDPVLVRIDGRASFQNSACLRDFISEMLRQGKTRLVIDFMHCASMDSTFLGVLAGAALEMKKLGSGASLILSRVGQRNLELIRNLGLHRLLTVDAGDFPLTVGRGGAALPCENRSELEQARLVLEAHENLVAADETNRAKFQDVMAFLKNRVAS